MILNINKPKNWTSFDVVAKVRKQLNIKKVGHAGTLDPLATGVLIVLTGPDTKKQSQIMNTTKKYYAKIAFGIESASYDLEGPIEVLHKNLEVSALQKPLNKAIKKYTGQFEQTAPLFSAKKVKGKKLYKVARKAQNSPEALKQELKHIELPKKLVNVYEFDLVSFENEEIILASSSLAQSDTNLKLTLPVLTCEITCTSGTYIRSIAHDLGAELNTGATLIDLKRTVVGNFTVKDSIEIEDVRF